MSKKSKNSIVKKVVVSAALLAALVTSSFVVYDSLPKNYSRVLYVGEFNSESVNRVMSNIIKAEKESSARVLLEITSPGGEVMSGDAVVVELSASDNIDTYIPSFAASMGAETFMQGKRRYMEEHAEILFHGVSAGGITEPMAKTLIDFVGSGDSKIYRGQPDGSDTQKAIAQKYPDVGLLTLWAIAKLEADDGTSSTLKLLREVYHELQKINERSLDRWNSFIAKSKGKWTRELVKEKIYGNYKKDMVFTGTQMLEMGMIDGLGRPKKG